jgi:hypothetical protein
MFMLKLKGGIEITEKEVGCWDNVPVNVEIESLGIGIERQGLKPYIVQVKGYEEICCAKMGSSLGKETRMIGWVVFGVRGETVTEFSIGGEGIELKSYPREKLTLRISTLRKMVG